MLKTDKKMIINVGPQHPSTHGVLRLIVELEGEVVKSVEPVIGYLHRGMEKMAESRTYFQYLPIVDRVDYLSSFFCAEAYVQAVEKLLEIEPPRYAQYVRVMLMELNRIASHLLWLGTFMLDLGATSPLFYCFEEREIVLSLFEELTGQRMMYNYHTFGGIKMELPTGFLAKIEKFLKRFPARIKDYEAIITKNPIFLDRTENMGILSSKVALDYSITGANIRASGVRLDMRVKEPYLIYNDLDFNIETTQKGDSYSRYLVRIAEMRQSIELVQQCVDWLYASEPQINYPDIKPHLIKPKTGMSCGIVESSRGALICFVYSNGTDKPYRVKWRTPSFYATQILPKLLINKNYADIMAIFGSLDIILPEVDR